LRQYQFRGLAVFDLYSLFPFLEGTDTDLATAVLRYKAIVLASEDQNGWSNSM
jgi:hypothetical protein